MKGRVALCVAALAASGLVQAATIDWNPWSSSTVQTMGDIITPGASFGDGSGGGQAFFDSATFSVPILVADEPLAGPSVSAILIPVAGDTVPATQGNGTFQYLGAPPGVPWTSPARESWYGFDVGIDGLMDAVTEPASLGLMLAALTMLGLTRRPK